MSCPDCNSPNAVSKAEAWDAAVEVPPKAARTLAELQEIARAARLIQPQGTCSEHSYMTVRADYVDALMELVEKYKGSIDPQKGDKS